MRQTKLYYVLRQIKYFFLRVFMRLFWVCPIEKDKIVLCNFNGKGFGDNPKYIAEQLLKEGFLNLYWIVEDENVYLPQQIKKLKKNTVSAIYHMATAKIWIDNARKEANMVKRSGQFYLQTWHGSIALKRIELDAKESLNSFYVSYAKRDAKYTNMMISNSSFSDRMFSEAFWFNGEVCKVGSPRLDIMFQTDSEKIRKQLGINSEDYVVLYAPTFRSDWSTDKYLYDMKPIKDAFSKMTNKNVVVLVRVHPNIASIVKYDVEDSFIKNVSGLPDVYEIMRESDALITDYSSLMFEFPVAQKKPVFLYACDVEQYDRGFYFDINELPFPLSRTEAELASLVSDYSKEVYESDLDAFYKKIDLLEDGKASKRVVEYIRNVLTK